MAPGGPSVSSAAGSGSGCTLWESGVLSVGRRLLQVDDGDQFVLCIVGTKVGLSVAAGAGSPSS